jgi:UDP-2-acetamido-3-amino-2,3-dideoxy-glucuronate N-acetyltransferase
VRGTLPAARVHPTAVVEEGATVGNGTQVWHHAHVRAGATVGQECVLGKNVFVDSGAVIGDRVKIQNNVSIYSGVTLEDEVFVGPGAVITNDRVPRVVGPWDVTETRVARGASIGANATVVGGIDIGEWAMVAAGSVVTRPVGTHELVMGNPGRRVAWVCRCGTVRVRPGEGDVLACPACNTRFGPLS